MAIGRRGDGTVGPTDEVSVKPTISTGPTIKPREDFKMERRDPANARLEALRERFDVYKAAGEDTTHLAKLIKAAEKGGVKREERAEEAKPKPKATTRKTRDGTGFFYEDGHGVEPKHPDSTDAEGYHVPRPADAPGADPLPAYSKSDYDAIEPVEKYPDFANPHKTGDQIPQAAHDRGVVPEHLKKSGGKSMEQVQKDREESAEKAAAGKPVDPEKAINPAPDPHQAAVSAEGAKAAKVPAKAQPAKK